MRLIETTRGLPNTCTKCGKPIKGGKWFAKSDDHARAGQGYCAKCAKALAKPPKPPKQEPEPAKEPEPQAEETGAEAETEATTETPQEGEEETK